MSLYKTPIKLIIFDNDGTLMNTEWVYGVAHKMCTGHELVWDLRLNLMGRTPHEASKIIIDHYGLNETPESLTERRTKIVYQYWPSIPLMPGAKAIVDEFKKRALKMTIATASYRPEFDLKASGHKDFVALMDHVICADDVKNGKPAPDLFLKALSMFEGIKPEEALVFEDSPLGIRAANLAGMASVFIPAKDLNAEESLAQYNAKPTCIINTLENFDFSQFSFE